MTELRSVPEPIHHLVPGRKNFSSQKYIRSKASSFCRINNFCAVWKDKTYTIILVPQMRPKWFKTFKQSEASLFYETKYFFSQSKTINFTQVWFPNMTKNFQLNLLSKANSFNKTIQISHTVTTIQLTWLNVGTKAPYSWTCENDRFE